MEFRNILHTQHSMHVADEHHRLSVCVCVVWYGLSTQWHASQTQLWESKISESLSDIIFTMDLFASLE